MVLPRARYLPVPSLFSVCLASTSQDLGVAGVRFLLADDQAPLPHASERHACTSVCRSLPHCSCARPGLAADISFIFSSLPPKNCFLCFSRALPPFGVTRPYLSAAYPLSWLCGVLRDMSLSFRQSS
ncbi:hypothetical protein LZ31DRAFT_361335 [Colletotrichum somersetense]|nr:hypothetical protein LZ31DRAFT_361335 [Colletotrichum somersetense]